MTSVSRVWSIGVTSVALALLVACAPGPAPTPASTDVLAPTPAARFTALDVRRAGGIAGVDDRVAVSAQGAWSASGKAGSAKQGTLSQSQLDTLIAYAADPRLAKEATEQRAPTACRDAFSYVVTVDALTVAYVDCPTDGPSPQVASSIVGVLTDAGALP
ncbi:MAG: hypothetical protein HOV79_34360 [Hamadaea sp.]|nr:hypothetical protein [Hamadaea sp.]